MDSIGHLADPQSLVEATLAKALRPDPVYTVSEWADAHRILSSKASAEPGPWRTERTPYLRGIMDVLSPGHPATEVTFVKGTQVGGSEAGFNWLGAIIDLWPAPVILVMPTEKVARAQVRQRIDPMIESTPSLRQKVAEAKSRASANTVTEKEFPGGSLYVAWSSSAAELASKPIRFIYADEVDKYGASASGEGDPMILVEKRAATFARRKIFRCSSPVHKSGRITRYWEGSDQRRYYVPCPHCSGEQWLKWEQMRWKLAELRELTCLTCGAVREHEGPVTECPACGSEPAQQRITVRTADFIEKVWYECEACHQEIPEHFKGRMLALGRWVAHKPGPDRQPGFHLSALYSPLGWFSWRDAVKQFLEAQQDTAGILMQNFVNTVLGQGWEPRGTSIDADPLRDRTDAYRIGNVPAGALVLTASVDVQGNRLEYLVKGWGRAEESWLVDFGQIYGDPAQMGDGSVWTELEKVLDKRYPHEFGVTLKIRAMAIDSGGHHTQQVYWFTSKHAKRDVFAVKGHNQAGRPILGRPSAVDITHKGRVIKDGAHIFMVGSDTAKSAIYARLMMLDESGKPVREGPGVMHFPEGLPDGYFSQLTSERREDRWINGFVKHEWVKDAGARNEALDLEVYAMAAAIYAGVTRVDFDKLEASLKPPKDAPAQQPKPASSGFFNSRGRGGFVNGGGWRV